MKKKLIMVTIIALTSILALLGGRAASADGPATFTFAGGSATSVGSVAYGGYQGTTYPLIFDILGGTCFAGNYVTPGGEVTPGCSDGGGSDYRGFYDYVNRHSRQFYSDSDASNVTLRIIFKDVDFTPLWKNGGGQLHCGIFNFLGGGPGFPHSAQVIGFMYEPPICEKCGNDEYDRKYCFQTWQQAGSWQGSGEGPDHCQNCQDLGGALGTDSEYDTHDIVVEYVPVGDGTFRMYVHTRKHKAQNRYAGGGCDDNGCMLWKGQDYNWGGLSRFYHHDDVLGEAGYNPDMVQVFIGASNGTTSPELGGRTVTWGEVVVEGTLADPIELLEDLKSEIDELTDDAFQYPCWAKWWKRSLCRKVDAAIRLVEDSNYEAAVCKLEKDVKKAIERWIGESSQDPLIKKVDAVINILLAPRPRVHNINTAEDFYTIQAAIDDDDTVYGDTIVVDPGTYNEYVHITKDGLTIQGAGIDKSIIDMNGLTPYWHYSSCSSSFASRGGILISGYGSPDEIIEDVTFKGFTVKNVGLNVPITSSGTHDGSDGVTILTDSTASWTPGALVGQWVHNLDDRCFGTTSECGSNPPIRSYGKITGNTDMTVTATLAGGLENDWDNGDTYVITPYEHFLDSSNKDGQDDVHGISVANGKNVVIEDVKVQNSGSRGITVGAARCTSLKQSEDITVKNCIVLDNHSQGISIGDHIGTITITGNTVSNNKRPHISDPTREYAGIGIYATGENSSKTITGVISGNTVSSNGFEGIALYKWVDGVTIENNTVTGHNFDQDGAGIFFYYWGRPERCKNVTVRNNIVTGNIRGIVAYYASDSTIEDNTITTDSGAFPQGQGAIKLDGSNNIEVKNNIIGTSRLDGTGISVVYWEGYGSVSSYNNTFTGNTICGAKFAGVFISGDAHDNTFTNNCIRHSTSLTRWAGQPYEETQADGVFIDDDAGTGNMFHNNCIFDNADDGMENQAGTSVDATGNWWGHRSGPYHPDLNPEGKGDAVSDDVEYDPWLEAQPEGVCPPPPKHKCGAAPMYRDGALFNVSAMSSFGHALLPLVPALMALGIWAVSRRRRKK
jgi:parallel beta-helix repeat protein